MLNCWCNNSQTNSIFHIEYYHPRTTIVYHESPREWYVYLGKISHMHNVNCFRQQTCQQHCTLYSNYLLASASFRIRLRCSAYRLLVLMVFIVSDTLQLHNIWTLDRSLLHYTLCTLISVLDTPRTQTHIAQ